MTTEREARVPEHPGWQPTWLRVAEYDGQRVVLHTWDDLADWDNERWGVCDGTCDDYKALVGTYSSLAEAEAAFEAACDRLREGA